MITRTHKDFLNRNIIVGDTLVFSGGKDHRYLRSGIVIGFGPQMVRVEITQDRKKEMIGKIVNLMPHNCAIVQRDTNV